MKETPGLNPKGLINYSNWFLLFFLLVHFGVLGFHTLGAPFNECIYLYKKSLVDLMWVFSQFYSIQVICLCP